MMTLYRRCLALYPRAFQCEFGEEMAAVYGEALADSRRHGRLACARFYFREFSGLMGGALAQRLRAADFSWERILHMRNGFRYSWVGIGFMTLSFVVVLMAMSKAAAIAAGYSQIPVINLVRPLAVVCAVAVAAGVLGWLIVFAAGRSGEVRLAQIETWQKNA